MDFITSQLMSTFSTCYEITKQSRYRNKQLTLVSRFEKVQWKQNRANYRYTHTHTNIKQNKKIK